MTFKPVDPAVQGSLDSLRPYFPPREMYTAHGQLAVIQDCFAERASGPCRIVAADEKDKEVHFTHRELFNRYAVMPIISQSEFLAAIRKVMAANSTEKMFLNGVTWSKAGMFSKTIRVDLDSKTGTLTFSAN